jgi:hypothetical protein
MDGVTQLGANTDTYQSLPVSQSTEPDRDGVNQERVKGRAVVHGLKIEVDACPFFRETAPVFFSLPTDTGQSSTPFPQQPRPALFPLGLPNLIIINITGLVCAVDGFYFDFFRQL